MAKKPSIDAYKDRMTCPVGAVLIDPKTKKPIKPTKTNKPIKKGK